MSIKYENAEEIVDWINNVFHKTPWFHELTCVCGATLKAVHLGDEAWLECTAQHLEGKYFQKIPQHILKLMEVYPTEIPNPLTGLKKSPNAD